MTAADVRSKVLARAIASLGAIDGVDAIYLSGSLAEQTEDQYSDIDLRVVILDSTYETVRARREQLPTSWGPFLFHQTVAESHTVTYYDSLTKADVFYYAAGTLAPSPWFNLGTRVLLDRSGHLGSVIESSKVLTFTSMPNEIVRHIQVCIAGLVEGAKRVRRGEPIYASRLCTDAVHHLLVADDLLSRRAPFGSSKRERRVPGDLTAFAQLNSMMPTAAASQAYFSRLATGLRQQLLQAEGQGQCTGQIASRLRVALDQLVVLAGGQDSV